MDDEEIEYLDRLDEVTGPETFTTLVLSLRLDLVNHENDWQNPRLDMFLESLSALVPLFVGRRREDGLSDIPGDIWKEFAALLVSARDYE